MTVLISFCRQISLPYRVLYAFPIALSDISYYIARACAPTMHGDHILY